MVNQFPFSLSDKRNALNQSITNNQTLDKENKRLFIELQAKSETNMEILESIARHRFGLIKDNEHYYQISHSDTNPDKSE